MNAYLFNLINQFALRYAWLDYSAIFFANYFQYLVTASLIVFLILDFKKYWKIVILALFSGAFARAFVEIIYFFYPTTRPFAVLPRAIQLISHSPANSFPSGHATLLFALATIIFLYNKKAGIVYYIFAFLISLARVFCGVHWPADILGGAIIGILISLILNKLYENYFFRSRRSLRREYSE